MLKKITTCSYLQNINTLTLIVCGYIQYRPMHGEHWPLIDILNHGLMFLFPTEGLGRFFTTYLSLTNEGATGFASGEGVEERVGEGIEGAAKEEVRIPAW